MISFDISVYTGGTLAEAAKTTATSEHSTKVSGDRLEVNKQTNKLLEVNKEDPKLISEALTCICVF